MVYLVTLTADAIVSATLRVEADSPSEAEQIAIQAANENQFEVDSLHETPEIYETKLAGRYVKAEHKAAEERQRK